jgi:hypothetical protein
MHQFLIKGEVKALSLLARFTYLSMSRKGKANDREPNS